MTVMTDEFSRDFRFAAITASERALKSLGSRAGASPVEAGISYCVRSPVDASALIRMLKALAIGGVFVILAGFGGTAIFIYLAQQHLLPVLPAYIGAACCGAIGYLFCFLPTMMEGRLSRKYLQKNLGNFWADKTLTPDFVSIENAHTYNQLKALAEDTGYLLIHPEAHCLEVEAISCRYLIYAADVLDLSLHANGKTILVSYKAAGERLDLAIIPRSIVGEVKHQTLGSGRDRFHRVQQALTLPPAPPSP